MGRGTDISAGSSVREAALHPGGAQALPSVAAQRGANPGQLHLPVTAEARTGRSLARAAGTCSAWLGLPCFACIVPFVRWDEHSPSVCSCFQPRALLWCSWCWRGCSALLPSSGQCNVHPRSSKEGGAAVLAVSLPPSHCASL